MSNWKPIATMTNEVWAYVPGWADGDEPLPSGPVVRAQFTSYGFLATVGTLSALVRAIVAAAVAELEGTGLHVAVVAWKPGLATGVQSIAIGSDHADEAKDAFRLAHLVCVQGDGTSGESEP